MAPAIASGADSERPAIPFAGAHTERGLDRFVTFLDAVVAIAITLLVLPLADAIGTTGAGRDLGTLLSDEAGRFSAFLLSLVLIARLWLAHHRILEGVGAYDTAFLLVNIAWILTIVLVPFVTQVAGSYPPEPLAVLIYIGTLTLNSACLSAISLLVWHRPALQRSADTAPAPPRAALVTTGALVVALLLGTLLRSVNYWALSLLVVTSPIESWLRRTQHSL
jgi:uncharacterized membrane protein